MRLARKQDILGAARMRRFAESHHRIPRARWLRTLVNPLRDHLRYLGKFLQEKRQPGARHLGVEVQVHGGQEPNGNARSRPGAR
jgi:hypothetical protein